MVKKKKGDEEEKIRELEERIRQLEKEKIEKSEGSLVGGMIGNILPGFGKIIGTLEKASPEFRKRIEETDKEIRFRLEKGSSAPRIEYSFSRPLVSGKFVRKEEEIKSVVVYEETPPVEKEELRVYPIGKKLIIETKDRKFYKEVPLQCYVKNLKFEYKKGDKKGLLVVRMEKR